MIEYFSHIATLLAINIILATSLNLINGYCGLFSLGHAGFYAVGAYASAAASMFAFPEFTASHPELALVLACVIGMVASGLVGLAVGVPCLRLTGDYLAIATVGFGEIIRIVILNMDSVGASRGLPGVPKLTNLWSVWIAALLTVLLFRNLMRSSFGRAIVAVREDEIAARSMGVNVRFYKTFAFVGGSMFAGLAGGLFAHNQQFLHPNNFNFMVTVTVLLMVVVGGMGSQIGAILGAIIVTILPEALRFNENLSQIRMLIFGLVMILVMLWQPTGLMGLLRKKAKVAA
ncbi:MAG: branched-chain amino acid ABC transporter permease [Bdellovibrionales bacterium]|nr:branched-chain amino acid ABC transporter permease [Bdellovibrionales bacterium]